MFLVGFLVFKTSERRAASLAGSIPVRLRHQHLCRVTGVLASLASADPEQVIRLLRPCLLSLAATTDGAA